MTIETPLPGLDGTTPLGFLAALGTQAAYTGHQPPTLRWDTTTATPIIVGRTLDDIAHRTHHAYTHLAQGPAVTGKHVKDDLKYPTPTEVRNYLQAAQTGGKLAAAFAAAQVSEGAVAATTKPSSKPSALHFTSGNMRFLKIARHIATGTNSSRTNIMSTQNVREVLTKPHNGLTLLRWGPTDGPVHALRPTSPTDHKERRHTKTLTSPAPTALALLGMSYHPTWTNNNNRCITHSFFGPWPHTYVWPLWEQPASHRTVKSILAQTRPTIDDNTARRYAQWGITTIWAATIHQSGHYLSFDHAKVVWQTP